MLTIIIVIIVIEIAFAIIFLDYFPEIFVAGLFIGLIIGFIIGLFIPKETKIIIDKTYYLECLQDGNSINGSFFLGCGSVNGKMVYTYYYQDGDCYKMDQIDYDNVSIKYSEGRPKIEILKEIKTDAIKNLFTTRLNCECENSTIIYIPKGLIKQSFNLDAQ